MLNHIALMGRLTRDPEIRHTQTGVPVASFSLAVERDFASQSGERAADFIDIVAWRSTGEFAGKYFKKGQLVAVSGRLQIRGWTDNSGNTRRSAEVVADSVYFAEPKRDGEKRSDGTEPYSAPPQEYDGPEELPGGFAEIDEDDGDLPF